MKNFYLSLLAMVAMAPAAAFAQQAIRVENPTIIDERPEGEVMYYDRVGSSLKMQNGFVIEVQQEGQMEVVYGEDGEVYLLDPVCYFTAGSYVRGTIEDDIITVPMGQAVKHYENISIYNAEVWMCTITRNIFGSVLISNNVLRNTDISEAHFQIADGKIFLLESDEDHGLGVFYDDTRVWTGYADYKGEADVVEVPIRPATPAITGCDVEGLEGLANLTCYVPLEDEDGNPIDPDMLYYRIYTDIEKVQELVTVLPEDYEDVEEPMTEIPYNFFNDHQITIGAATFQLVNSRANELNYVGIQSVYYGTRKLLPAPEGSTVAPNESEIFWFKIKDYKGVGISEVSSDAPVVSTRYIDMTGRQSATAPAGVSIRVSTHSDGTVSTMRVIK